LGSLDGLGVIVVKGSGLGKVVNFLAIMLLRFIQGMSL